VALGWPRGRASVKDVIGGTMGLFAALDASTHRATAYPMEYLSQNG